MTALAVSVGLIATLADALPAGAAVTVDTEAQSTWQTDGALDSRGKNLTGRVLAVAYGHGASAGRVFIAGSFTSVKPPRGQSGSPVARTRLAALDETTGALLTGFDVSVTRGDGGDATIEALALSPDGATLYLGGYFTRVDGRTRNRLAALDASSGALLPLDLGAGSLVKSLAVSPDGSRLYVGGHFTTFGGQPRVKLAAVDLSTGTVVQGWDPAFTQESGQLCPPRCYPTVYGLAVSPDGQTLYVGGSFAFVDNVARNSAAAISTADGTLLPWDPNVYQGGLKASLNIVYEVQLDASHIFLCGDFWALGAGAGRRVSPNVVAVDPANGLADPAWVASTDGAVNHCEASEGLDRLVVGGHFEYAGGANAATLGTGQYRQHVAAFALADGALDPWNPRVNSVPGVYGIDSSAGHLGIGGHFTQVNFRAQQGFAQFGWADGGG